MPEEEMREFVRVWEAWDETLARIMLVLSEEPLEDVDREILLETLLEMRHEFLDQWNRRNSDKDFVRSQFVRAWKRLSPLYRRQLVDEPSPSLLGYLAFFTASDALVTLDRIGPTLGIEISRSGLIRLLGMIQEGRVSPLDYLPDVVPELRRVLGLGPPLASIPAKSMEKGATGFARRLYAALLPEAYAESPVSDEDIQAWVVPLQNKGPYLERVRHLLSKTVDRVLDSSALPPRYRDLYRRLATATAWQESCFRQFVRKNDEITFLLSYNGTSVGLMQINERVWRGIYGLQDLRWDIHYNALAGCEILDTYFNRYALKKLPHEEMEALGEETLARIVYAMYNGGPAQLQKFLARRQRGHYYRSDRLFFEKYLWVTDGRWERILECL
jgi:hypothetical protein